MSQEQALYQSLAACGATLVAFIGVCHELIGHVVFPWAPELLGPIGWHGLGWFAIGAGLLVLGGTLRLFRFPVVPFTVVAALIAFAVMVLTAVLHGEFHAFALLACIAATVTAYCHPRSAPAPPVAVSFHA
jgi:hypothetical protein